MQSIIPDSLDLLFMTIEGQSQFIPEAESFIDLFKPKRIIPMHFWSQEYRAQFLNYLTIQNDSGKTYQIFEPHAPKLDIYQTDSPQPVEVYSLIRDAYSTTKVQTETGKNYEFKLEQNYPNPFNPSTKIKFSIPKTPEAHGNVSLKLIVYDVLGKEVAVLLNKPLSAGTHYVTFSGLNLPSGVYLYTLIYGDFRFTRKMLLMK